MQRIFKTFILLLTVMCASVWLPACSKKQNSFSENAKVKIEDVSYSSISDAVKNAKSGDTIKVYSDVSENRNIIINKPLSIVGVKNQNNVSPKFYGSFTINSTGENDTINISGLDIIHQGTSENSLENDTKIGINLVDGGLVVKENHISLKDEKTSEDGASGIILSRKISSLNTMPMIVKGNTFGNYKTSENGICGALIVKSSDKENFQNINLNNENLYRQNSFAFSESGNQFVSIKYSKTPYEINYMVTSSSKDLLDKLLNNQSSSNATFVLKNSNEPAEKNENKIPIYEQTAVYIEGNKPADFGENVFALKGSISLLSDMKNATIEKQSATASVLKDTSKTFENIKIIQN